MTVFDTACEQNIRALAIRAEFIIYVYPLGRAEQTGGRGGRGGRGWYEHPGVRTYTCQIQVGVPSVYRRVLCTPARLQLLVSPLFSLSSRRSNTSHALTHGGRSLGLKPPPLTAERAAGSPPDGLCGWMLSDRFMELLQPLDLHYSPTIDTSLLILLRLMIDVTLNKNRNNLCEITVRTLTGTTDTRLPSSSEYLIQVGGGTSLTHTDCSSTGIIQTVAASVV